MLVQLQTPSRQHYSNCYQDHMIGVHIFDVGATLTQLTVCTESKSSGAFE